MFSAAHCCVYTKALENMAILSEKLVVLGEMDNYEPLCRKCYTDIKTGFKE